MGKHSIYDVLLIYELTPLKHLGGYILIDFVKCYMTLRFKKFNSKQMY